jgi:hypothetical protein
MACVEIPNFFHVFLMTWQSERNLSLWFKSKGHEEGG